MVWQVVSAGSVHVFVEDVLVDDLVFEGGLEVRNRLAIVERLF